MEMHRRAIKLKRPFQLLLMVLSFVLSLLILEFGLHLFTKEKYVPYSWVYFYQSQWNTDKDLIFISERVKSKLENFKEENSTLPQIITLGDSFTEAELVEESKNFPSQLSKELQKLHKDSSVVNLGVGGYGPDQELALLTTALEKGMRPDIVVWQFFPNDIYENASQVLYLTKDGRLERVDAQKSWVYIFQTVYKLIPLPAKLKQKSRIVNLFLSYSQSYEYSSVPTEEKTSFDSTVDWSVKKVSLELKVMNELAKRYNFTLYPVMISPQYSYLNEQEKQERLDALGWLESYQEKMDAVLKKEPNFISIDFKELSNNTDFKDFIISSEKEYKNYYFDDGTNDPLPYGNRHFNEVGYQTWAKVFSKILQDDKVFQEK